MAEDVSVNSVIIDKAVKTTEQVIAESDAAIKACEEFVAVFGDTNIDEFDD
jgi:hypothetical protein